MIVVAIVGILAAVAYPSYMSQVRKSRRSDAIQSLAAIQQAQERYRSNNPTYAANLTTLTINSASSGGYYTLAVPKSGASAPTCSTYTASAVAVSGKSQASDTGCSTMSITVTNGSATNDQASCWSQ